MADTKVSAMTSVTFPTLANTDIAPVVTTPSGTPANGQVTLAELFRAGAADTVSTGTNGRDTTISAQGAASGNNNGGALILSGGLHTGSGTDGAVALGQQPGGLATKRAVCGHDGSNMFIRSLFGGLVFDSAISPSQSCFWIDSGGGALVLRSNRNLGWSSGSTVNAAADTMFGWVSTGILSVRSSSTGHGYFQLTGTRFGNDASSVNAGIEWLATNVISVTNGAGAAGGWLQNNGRARLSADVTNATATLANLPNLSISLLAGRKYTGSMTVKCNNSVAAEGIQFDFNGGSATMTSFWASVFQQAGGTNVLGTAISTSLSGVVNYTTITGETVLEFKLSFVCNAAGTFIPRFAENTHSTGTATAELGSFILLEDTP